MWKISIEEAIVSVSGNYRYQKISFMIMCLGQTSLSFFIMGVPYMFPEFEMECDESGNCLPPKQFPNSGTVGLGLENSQYQVGFIRTSYFFGTMTGSMFLNWASDKYGRKRVLKYSCIAGILLMLISGFAWNALSMIIVCYFIGIVELGMYVTGFILCSEIIEAEYRNWYSGMYFVIWSVAAVILSLLYMLGITWRYPPIISAVLMAIEILFIGYLHESPRFL